MEIIIFIMEEWCQDLKARKHEKYGYRAKEYFLNISFWLHQLFVLPLLIVWGISIPFLFKGWISRRFVYLGMSFQEQQKKNTAEDNKQAYLFLLVFNIILYFESPVYLKSKRFETPPPAPVSSSSSLSHRGSSWTLLCLLWEFHRQGHLNMQAPLQSTFCKSEWLG